jgi:O-antigen ligase
MENFKHMVKKKNEIYENEYLLFVIVLFPLLIISGPFLPDLIVVFLSFFFLVKYKNFKFEKKGKLFLSLILIFYFLINISSFLSDHILLSLKSSFFYFRFIIFSFVVSILVQQLECNEKICKYFDYIFFCIFIFFFIDGFYQFFNGENLLGKQISSHLRNERVSSLFGEELILGSFVSKTMFIYLGFIHGQKINTNDKLNINLRVLFIFIVCLSTIFISGERAAFILALLGTIGYLILNLNFKACLIIIGSLMLVFFIAQNNVKLLHKYSILYKSIFVHKTIGGETHQQHFKTAYKMFNEKKFFGHGIKSFRKKCNIEKFNSGKKSCSTHPHNYYLQILSASGIFTFFILVGFFLFILKELVISLKNKITKNEVNNKKNCYLLSILISIFPFTTSGSFFNNWISITIFLSLGFLISEYRIIKYSRKKS